MNNKIIGDIIDDISVAEDEVGNDDGERIVAEINQVEENIAASNEEEIEVQEQQVEYLPYPLNQLEGKTAEDLINRFELDSHIPVNLDELFLRYGISLYSTDFSSLEESPDMSPIVDKKGSILGAVVVDDGKLNILYRSDDSMHRQRFTVAHELAHCCINARELAVQGHVEFRIDVDEETSPLEIEANIFAGELLIPKSALDKIYSVLRCPYIDNLATIFNVSNNVMRGRLHHLGYPFKEEFRLDF